MFFEDNYGGAGAKEVFSTFSSRNVFFSYCYNLSCLFRGYVTERNFPHHVIRRSGFDHCAKLDSKPGLLQYKTSPKTRGETD